MSSIVGFLRDLLQKWPILKSILTPKDSISMEKFY